MWPMATKRARDPRDTVTQATARRQGIVTQADIQETKRATARIAGLGDDLKNLVGPIHIAKDVTITEGLLLIEIINDLVDGLIIQPADYNPAAPDGQALMYYANGGIYLF